MSSFTVQDGGGHGSLTVAETPVAGAHSGLLKHLESLLFKSGAEETDEAAIVHAAAAQAHVIDSGLPAGVCRRSYKALRNSRMELRCDLRPRHSAPKISHNCLPEMAYIERE